LTPGLQLGDLPLEPNQLALALILSDQPLDRQRDNALSLDLLGLKETIDLRRVLLDLR
jgi:hypothetical protein